MSENNLNQYDGGTGGNKGPAGNGGSGGPGGNGSGKDPKKQNIIMFAIAKRKSPITNLSPCWMRKK